MSFSNPRTTNPCTKFIEYNGANGTFTYFDKTKGEKGEKLEITLPCYFVVLDEFAMIKGFCKKVDSGFVSNEVRNISEDILKVRTFKGGIEIIGKYKDISDKIKALGGKYTKSVYCLMIIDKGKYELVNFGFKGSSLNAWIDKKIDTEKFGIKIEEKFNEETNGATTYKVPIFKAVDISRQQSVIDEAIRIDRDVLQPYLKAYISQQIEKETTEIKEAHEQAKSNNERPILDDNEENFPDEEPLSNESFPDEAEFDDLPF